MVATLVELSLVDCVGTDTLPFIDTSPPTYRLLFKETSPPTNKRLLIFKSFVKVAVDPANVDNLFVTYAVVATLFELSLTSCVIVVTFPFIDTSPLIYKPEFI